MKLQIPKGYDMRRVKVSPFEAKKTFPYDLLSNRLSTYGKIAREDVYAALVLMCADGSITKREFSNLEFYFKILHPTNMKPDVAELVKELLQELRAEMGTADQIAVKPFPEDFLKGALLDPRLVGIWRQNEPYSSGDFYATTYTFMEFVSDGTYRTGSRVDVSMTHRFSSGAFGGSTSGSSAAGLQHTGEWETEEKVLVLRPAWGPEERLDFQVDDRGLLTQKYMGENKFYVRVSG